MQMWCDELLLFGLVCLELRKKGMGKGAATGIKVPVMHVGHWRWTALSFEG